MTETIDIVYCYRNRDLKRVKNSLDSLTQQTNKQFRVIFIDYGSDEVIAELTKNLCANYDFCAYTFIDTRGKMWNRADALNHGFFLSKASHVFTSDIDMIFRDNFVASLYKNTDKEGVSFFSVGYLSEAVTRAIDIKKITNLPYSKSKNFALGMMFASKEILTKINGYNSFYCLWGAEDNDIKYRLEQAGHKTFFVEEEVYMLHQYHAPSVSDESVLPKGWIQFMKDYQADYKTKTSNFLGLNQIEISNSRPAINVFNSADTVFETFESRNLFVKHRLISDIQNMAANASKAYKFKVTEIENSFFYKTGKFLNRLFKTLRIPLYVNSVYESQYLSKNECRDTVYFVLKCLAHLIKDYYIAITDSEIKLVIVKK